MMFYDTTALGFEPSKRRRSTTTIHYGPRHLTRDADNNELAQLLLQRVEDLEQALATLVLSEDPNEEGDNTDDYEREPVHQSMVSPRDITHGATDAVPESASDINYKNRMVLARHDIAIGECWW